MKAEPTALDWFATLRRAYRKHKATRELQRRVDAWNGSYEGRQYRERRAAAKKGVERRREVLG